MAAGHHASLDRNSDAPLHAQIADWLREDIRSCGLQSGTVLPSEAQLMARFSVARSVVRQALANLVNEGIILRQPGRAPIVAPPREHHRLVQRATGMFDQFARSGVRLRSQVLSLGRQTPPPEVAAFFESNNLILLERIRFIDDAPLALVNTWLPASLLSSLDVAALKDASLHGLLKARAGLLPGPGRNRIKAVAARAEQGARLGVAEGSPLLLLEGLGRDQHGQPMEYFFTWHRSEQVVFDVDVTGEDEKVSRRYGEPVTMGGSVEARGASTDVMGTSMEPSNAVEKSRSSADTEIVGARSVETETDRLARAERLVTELAHEIARLKAGH